eukprot:m.187488 g.187488  ORF g.187488 m.187488 type:complete len:150 (-) comp25624_c0_seq7:120-569(-)
MKDTYSGDTLQSPKHKKTEHYVLKGISIPEPVFSCSIECESLADENKLEEALGYIQQDDPSVRVTENTETGQTILSGMGELHLEIVLKNIRSYFGVPVQAGPVHVAYREQPKGPAVEEHTTTRTIGAGSQVFLLPRLNFFCYCCRSASQ